LGISTDDKIVERKLLSGSSTQISFNKIIHEQRDMNFGLECEANSAWH